MSDSGHYPTLSSVDIGERIEKLRRLLGLSQSEVARRSRDRSGALDHKAVGRIEKGELKLTTVLQRQRLARGLGLTLSDLEALIRDEIAPETAWKLAKKESDEVERTIPPSGQPSLSPEEQGERMGSAIVFDRARLADFPNLEFCLEYHRRNGKIWDSSVVAAARAHHFGEVDLATTGDWERALDRLQAVMRHATIDAANAAPKALPPRSVEPEESEDDPR